MVSQMTYAEKLLRRMWKTKGIRFDASRRFERKQKAANLSINLLSLYSIIITTCAIVFDIDVEVRRYIYLASVAIPIFILIISNHEYSKQYGLLSERMRISAQKIQVLYNDLDCQLKSNHTDVAVDDVVKKYDEILTDFSEGHENIDYLFFVSFYHNTPNLEEYERFNPIKRMYYLAMYKIDIWWIPSIFVFSPLLLIFIILILQ